MGSRKCHAYIVAEAKAKAYAQDPHLKYYFEYVNTIHFIVVTALPSKSNIGVTFRCHRCRRWSCCQQYLPTAFSSISRVRYPVWQHTFVSPSAFSRRAVVSYWRKYVHEVLVNPLGGLSLPRKSVVRLTDRPDMTLDVYRGRKTTIQQQSSISQRLSDLFL